jgi:hypothetical protein
MIRDRRWIPAGIVMAITLFAALAVLVPAHRSLAGATRHDDPGQTVRGAAPDTACGRPVCPIIAVNGADAIWRSPTGQMWVSGFGGLGVVHWDGRHWVHYSRMGGFKSVWGSADDDVWAVGDNVVHWDGRRWEERRSGLGGSPGLLWVVWGSSRNDVWAAGEFGRVVHWNGSRWEGRPFGAERDVQTIAGSSANDVWAGTIDDELRRWDGRSWQTQSPPPFRYVLASVQSLAVAGPDSVWLADGEDLFRWDGRRWNAVLVGIDVQAVLLAGDRLLAWGTERDHVTPAAREWRENQWRPLPVSGSSPVSAIAADHRGRVWQATNRGDVVRVDPPER